MFFALESSCYFYPLFLLSYSYLWHPGCTHLDPSGQITAQSRRKYCQIVLCVNTYSQWIRMRQNKMLSQVIEGSGGNELWKQHTKAVAKQAWNSRELLWLLAEHIHELQSNIFTVQASYCKQPTLSHVPHSDPSTLSSWELNFSRKLTFSSAA